MPRTTHTCFMVYVAVCLLATAGQGMAASTCTPLPAGVIAWWPGNTDAQDISSNHEHAVLQSGAQAGVPGFVAGAFYFDGVTGMANTPVLLPQQGTVELWAKPSSFSTTHGLLGTFGMANGNDRLWMVATGPGGGPGVGPHRFVVNLGSCCTNDIDIPSPLVSGTWTHVALTLDYQANQHTLYVNGQAVATATAARNMPTHPVSFGAIKSDFGQAFFFPGLLDEVTLYDRVLSASEIRAIFNAGIAGKCVPFGGAMTGATLTKVVCQNKTMRRSTTILLPRGATGWNCTAAGLVVHAGDKISVTIEGTGD
jgi:hypothetical protein